jgi:hypothetical protein
MSFSAHFSSCNIFVIRTTIESHAHMNTWCICYFCYPCIWNASYSIRILKLFPTFIFSEFQPFEVCVCFRKHSCTSFVLKPWFSELNLLTKLNRCSWLNYCLLVLFTGPVLRKYTSIEEYLNSISYNCGFSRAVNLLVVSFLPTGIITVGMSVWVVMIVYFLRCFRYIWLILLAIILRAHVDWYGLNKAFGIYLILCLAFFLSAQTCCPPLDLVA